MPAAVPAGTVAGALPPEVSSERWPWRGVRWSLTYIGFLGYIYAITTYRFPIGDVSIVLALIGLLTTKEPIRVPGQLTETAVRAMASASGRADKGVYELTGGNPFFVTEVLATSDASVPASIRAAVLARASKLSSCCCSMRL